MRNFFRYQQNSRADLPHTSARACTWQHTCTQTHTHTNLYIRTPTRLVTHLSLKKRRRKTLRRPTAAATLTEPSTSTRTSVSRGCEADASPPPATAAIWVSLAAWTRGAGASSELLQLTVVADGGGGLESCTARLRSAEPSRLQSVATSSCPVVAMSAAGQLVGDTSAPSGRRRHQLTAVGAGNR